MEGLTGRQKVILATFSKIEKKKGWPAVVQEVADVLGIKNASVHHSAVVMKGKGFIWQEARFPHLFTVKKPK